MVFKSFAGSLPATWKHRGNIFVPELRKLRKCDKGELLYLRIARNRICPLAEIWYRSGMEAATAVETLFALGQATRLDTFRLLVRNGPNGIAAGNIADQLRVPRNTLSNHLAILTKAGLIASKREGTKVIYRANLSRLAELTAFLMDGCCDAQPEKCEPEFSNIVNLRGPSE